MPWNSVCPLCTVWSLEAEPELKIQMPRVYLYSGLMTCRERERSQSSVLYRAPWASGAWDDSGANVEHSSVIANEGDFICKVLPALVRCTFWGGVREGLSVHWPSMTLQPGKGSAKASGKYYYSKEAAIGIRHEEQGHRASTLRDGPSSHTQSPGGE